MMGAHAAVLATFEDVKRIKTRKAWQLIFEVPEENYDAAVFALGGSPQSGEDRWVGIARVDEKLAVVVQETPPAPEVTETPQEPERVKGGARAKRDWNELSAREQSVLRCKQLAFQTWVCGIGNEDAAAREVRGRCGLISRSDFDKPEYHGSADIWYRIDNQFQAAQRGWTDDTLATQLAEGPG